jgi:hypothetical protein
MDEQVTSGFRVQGSNGMGPRERSGESGWRTWPWVVITSVVYLGIIAAWSAIAAGLEAAEPGLAQVWMWAMAIIFVPVLWLASEVLGNPVLKALEELSWWSSAHSAARVALGVAGTLPFFAFMVWSFWLFRRWFGVPGW